MIWRFRPSTEPPRRLQLLMALVTPAQDRAVVLADLQDEYEELVASDGTERARQVYREQVLGSVAPGLRWRLARAGGLRAGHSGTRISPRWRPAPLVATDVYNRGETMLDFLNDFRLGLRSLARTPMIFTAAVVSLAIGIAASTTTFSMMNALLLRPPAVDLPDDVYAVFTSQDDGTAHGDVSYPDYLDVIESADAIEAGFLHRIGGVELEDESGRQRLLAELVGGHFFELTELPMTLGRGFTAEETPMGSAERLVVLSHSLWTSRYGADPAVLGRTVELDGRPYTVVGVGPEGYLSRFLGMRVDVWMPFGVPGGVYHATPSGLADRGDRQYRMLARLTPDASPAQAQSQLDTLAGRLHTNYGDEWADENGQPRRFLVMTEEAARLTPEMKAGIGGIFGMLLAVTGLVLLIACSNVACLFLARAHQRRREMALRLAIGAGRRRLVRMLMAESLLPAILAGVLGTAFAHVAANAMSSLPLPFAVPLSFDFDVDLTVLAFALVVSALASLVFGLLPALEAAAPDLVTSLKADAGTGDRRPRRFGLRQVLVVGQVAVSVAFVVAAGLTLRAVGRSTHMDTGIDVARNAVMSRNLPEDRFTSDAASQHFEDILERLRSRPEIDAAHAALSAEMSFFSLVIRAEVLAEEYEPAPEERTFFSYNSVTPGYLEMMELPLLRGRFLDAGDRPGSPPAAVVNEAFVERFWPGADGLGRRFRLGQLDSASGKAPEHAFEIVGVVRDGRYSSLTSGIEPYFWTSLPQQGWSRRLILHARGRSQSAEAVRALNEEVETVAGEAALVTPMPYEDLQAFQFFMPRMVARLVGWGGLFGMALAVFGIYGVVSFTAALRNREMAIRQAMGAHPRQVMNAVLGDGLKLALWGVAIGLAVIVTIAYSQRDLLFGVSPLDPVAVGGSAAVLLLAALAASWVPARRLMGVHPMGVLRNE